MDGKENMLDYGIRKLLDAYDIFTEEVRISQAKTKGAGMISEVKDFTLISCINYNFQAELESNLEPTSYVLTIRMFAKEAYNFLGFSGEMKNVSPKITLDEAIEHLRNLYKKPTYKTPTQAPAGDAPNV